MDRLSMGGGVDDGLGLCGAKVVAGKTDGKMMTDFLGLHFWWGGGVVEGMGEWGRWRGR